MPDTQQPGVQKKPLPYGSNQNALTMRGNLSNAVRGKQPQDMRTVFQRRLRQMQNKQQGQQIKSNLKKQIPEQKK